MALFLDPKNCTVVLLTCSIQALTRDLGLTECSPNFVKNLISGPIRNDPLGELEDVTKPDDVSLSTGGSISLLAYWVFSSTVFDADHPKPDMYVFPEHFAMLDQHLQDDAQHQITSRPGTISSLVALGLWLEENKLISAGPKTEQVTSATTAAENPAGNFMTYHHLLTLVAVYHPSIQARNAASALAGLILHADPLADDRLRILEDLLENCIFANLKACAVTWLREELISGISSAPTPSPSPGSTAHNIFATPEALDSIQYAVFPSLTFLKEADVHTLQDYWVQNSAFLLQAANFALFLWGGDGKMEGVVPEGMGAAVGERWAEPLWGAVETYLKAGEGDADEDPRGKMEVEILRDRLERLKGTWGLGKEA